MPHKEDRAEISLSDTLLVCCGSFSLKNSCKMFSPRLAYTSWVFTGKRLIPFMEIAYGSLRTILKATDFRLKKVAVLDTFKG